jgi:hypothetical protein
MEPLPQLVALEWLTIGELVGVVDAQFRTPASADALAPIDRHLGGLLCQGAPAGFPESWRGFGPALDA